MKAPVETKLTKLKPHPENPRHTEAAIGPVARSIEAFGFRVPVLVNKEYTILAGHVRVEAARRLGLKTVPVIMHEDLTPDQERAFLIADNKTATYAEFDFEKLTAIMSELSEAGFDLDSIGFDPEELDVMLSGAGGDGDLSDLEPDPAPPPVKDAHRLTFTLTTAQRDIVAPVVRALREEHDNRITDAEILVTLASEWAEINLEGGGDGE